MKPTEKQIKFLLSLHSEGGAKQEVISGYFSAADTRSDIESLAWSRSRQEISSIIDEALNAAKNARAKGDIDRAIKRRHPARQSRPDDGERESDYIVRGARYE